MTLGQCDILFHLAQLAERQKQARQACRYYRTIHQRFATVPSNWVSWKPNPNLPGRIQLAQEQYAQFCPTVPSIIHFKTIPSNTTISLKTSPTQWKSIAARTLASIQKRVTLRLEATGYITRVYQNVSIPRWQKKVLQFTLKKKPKLKPVVVADYNQHVFGQFHQPGDVMVVGQLWSRPAPVSVVLYRNDRIFCLLLHLQRQL